MRALFQWQWVKKKSETETALKLVQTCIFSNDMMIKGLKQDH